MDSSVASLGRFTTNNFLKNEILWMVETGKRKPRSERGLLGVSSDRNVGGLWALRSVFNVEIDRLTFGQ